MIRKTLLVCFVYFNDQKNLTSTLASKEEISVLMREVYGNNQKEESVNDVFNRISFGQFKFVGKNSTNVDFVNWKLLDAPSSEAHKAFRSGEYTGTYDYIQVNFLDIVCRTRSL